MIIREVTLKDIDALVELSKTTFFDTYGAKNTAADMEHYLETNFSKTVLCSELKDVNVFFYFLELESENVGYLKLNVGSAQTELKDAKSLEIERIYLKKAYQGKGLGLQLLKKAIAVGKEKAVTYIWLGVWEENPKAIQFYKKNGFEVFDTHTFLLGSDKQTDFMMRLNLK